MFSSSAWHSHIYQAANTMDGHSFPTLPRMRPAVSHDAPSVADLTTELQMAVKFGRASAAVDLAKRLAEIRPAISAKFETDSRTEESEMNLCVYVCNKDSSVDKRVIMKFRSSMTFESVKSMVFHKYGYFPELQKWIVGKQLANDEDTLVDLGINCDEAIAFLYILTPSDSFAFNASTEFLPFNELNSSGSMSNIAQMTTPTLDLNLSRETSNQSQSSHLAQEDEEVTWMCHKCTFVNKPSKSACTICGEKKHIYSALSFLSSQTDCDLNSASNIQDQDAAGYDFVDGSRTNL